MCFGGRFDSGIVYPNTGYEGLLGATFGYNGITLKIVGIFTTNYKELALDKKHRTEYGFNKSNIYSVALTAKNALYNAAEKAELFLLSAILKLATAMLTIT
jgi:hypothetical protein